MGKDGSIMAIPMFAKVIEPVHKKRKREIIHTKVLYGYIGKQYVIQNMEIDLSQDKCLM
jgi:hypothetical protein